jgi:hypothetical protein
MDRQKRKGLLIDFISQGRERSHAGRRGFLC